MQQTYQEAINQVFQDEGGYSNDVGDPGGPTNYGITIADARMYWKSDATAEDVKTMPKSVAEEIYAKHYATPLQYNLLPAGVDYAVLDYGINSGIHRSAKVLQHLVGVPADGIIGPVTVEAAGKAQPLNLIDNIYQERLAFLKSLSTWSRFGRGWESRCVRGQKLARDLYTKYHTSSAKAPDPTVPTPKPIPTPVTPTPVQVPSFWQALFNIIKLIFRR